MGGTIEKDKDGGNEGLEIRGLEVKEIIFMGNRRQVD